MKSIERDGRGRDPRDDDPAGDGLTPRDAELLRRAKTAFDAEAEALDAATRQRLAAARRAALAELEARGSRRLAPGWMPVGAAAAVAVAAVGVALTVRGPQPGAIAPGASPASAAAGDARGGEPASEMELLLGEDALGMFDEDPEFVAWAVEAAGAPVAGSDDAG